MPQTVRDFYDRYYLPLKLRGKSPNTKRLYDITIRTFDQFLCRPATLDDFDDDTVSRLLAWLVERNRSPATANKIRSQIIALWGLAARKRIVEKFPDVPPEIEPTRIPRAWTADELKRLFIACLDEPGIIAGVPANLWWFGLHLVAWDTGERIYPLRQLQFDWLSIDTGQLVIPAEFRKGRRSDMRYVLHVDTREVLRRILVPIRKIIFPWPWSYTLIYSRYAKIQRRAGLPIGRKFRFHCLRKSVASHGKVAGLDPKELMGHLDGRTTAKYLDPNICGQRPASETLFRPHDLPGRDEKHPPAA